MKNIISRNIKNLRLASGYSEALVAQVLEVETQIYREYENGLKELPFCIIEKLAILYDCEMSALFEENLDTQSLSENAWIKVNDFAVTDLPEIMHFKDIVNTYLKMDKMLVD